MYDKNFIYNYCINHGYYDTLEFKKCVSMTRMTEVVINLCYHKPLLNKKCSGYFVADRYSSEVSNDGYMLHRAIWKAVELNKLDPVFAQKLSDHVVSHVQYLIDEQTSDAIMRYYYASSDQKVQNPWAPPKESRERSTKFKSGAPAGAPVAKANYGELSFRMKPDVLKDTNQTVIGNDLGYNTPKSYVKGIDGRRYQGIDQSKHLDQKPEVDWHNVELTDKMKRRMELANKRYAALHDEPRKQSTRNASTSQYKSITNGEYIKPAEEKLTINVRYNDACKNNVGANMRNKYIKQVVMYKHDYYMITEVELRGEHVMFDIEHLGTGKTTSIKMIDTGWKLV